ncbi:MAG: arylesterase, partial [Desulfobacterales bacterium]|nr:arylesterase [Desulfobacterales bacterium]
AIYPDIAETHGLILMPFFLEGVAGNPQLNQPDGIHPTAEGYRIVTANLYPYVREAIARYEKRTSG